MMLILHLQKTNSQSDLFVDSREELDFKFDEELQVNERKRTASSSYEW